MAPYSGAAIDTHHHIWRRQDIGWLADPPIPRMFGDYFGIRRDYSIEEWMNDILPQGFTKSVHVTAMWGPGKELEETRWLQATANKYGFPQGIVCNANLSDPGVEAALTAMAAFPNLHVKLSGLGMYSNGVTYTQARQVIRDVIQIFGVERTIYGSNFPLEKLHASYADFFNIYRKVLAEYTEAEQRAVLHDNAVRFYRL